MGLDLMSKTTPQQLADGIMKCINTPSIQRKAKEVSEKMKQEDGPGKLVEVIQDYMESHVKTGKHLKHLDELLARKL